jgi:hypothetical protein
MDGWGWGELMGCAGSLTSCPGPKTTAVAAVCNSGHHKTLHIVHLLLFFNCDDGGYIAIFFSFPPADGEIE